MTKVAKIEPAAPPAETGISSILDKLMANPDLPIERAEQAFNFYMKVQDEQARKEFATAMVAAQAAMKPVRKDADNGQTKSKYASFDALDRAIRDIYTNHGFAISYNTETTAADSLNVVANVMHSSGYERRYEILMPSDGKGAKGGDVMTKTHATGSAFQYGRRYLLAGIFNLATTAKDDDGNKAGDPVGPINEAQYIEIADLIRDTKTQIEKVLEYHGIESLSDMPARDFKDARARLLAKKQGMPK
jgi:hypothetical protein